MTPPPAQLESRFVEVFPTPALLAMTPLVSQLRFGEAVRSFGRQHSCPANRLQVKHAEVRLADLVESKQPPAEVAADAGRLAVWNQTVNQELASYERLTAAGPPFACREGSAGRAFRRRDQGDY